MSQADLFTPTSRPYQSGENGLSMGSVRRTSCTRRIAEKHGQQPIASRAVGVRVPWGSVSCSGTPTTTPTARWVVVPDVGGAGWHCGRAAAGPDEGHQVAGELTRDTGVPHALFRVSAVGRWTKVHERVSR